MLKIRLAAVAFGAALGLCSVAAPARAQTILDAAQAGDPRFGDREFHELLDPTSDPSVPTYAWGTSTSGTFVAGQSAVGPSDCVANVDPASCVRAAVWSPAFGTSMDPGLFLLPGLDDYPVNASSYYAQARAIDADGDTMVGREEVCDGPSCPAMSRALAWTRTGPTWSAATTTVSLLAPTGYDSAGARGISDDGQFAVGWMANTSNLSATEAALWVRNDATSWQAAIPLGRLPTSSGTDPASSANGVAVDANGNPVVVGSSGRALTTNTFNRDGSDWSANVFSSGLFAVRPFVWHWGGSIQGLPMRPDEPRGDATAISADAKTIVGWVQRGTVVGPNYIEAQRWTHVSGTTWSVPQGLGTFALPQSISDVLPSGLPPDLRVPLGSVALGVSERGSAVVGYQSFGRLAASPGSRSFDLAFIWTESLGQGRYLGDVLKEAGVSLGNWVLFTGTSVRESQDFFVVVGDGCSGTNSQEDCFTEPERPGYIARIGRTPDSPSGITTPEEQMISFSEVSSAVLLAASTVGSTLAGLNDTAENHRCIRPEDGPTGNWCFFTFGTGSLFRGDIDGELDGDRFAGEVGIAHYFNPVTSVGASVGAGVTDSDLELGGDYRATDIHVGAYAAHIPDQGFRAFFGGVWGDLSDIELTRGYLNGVGFARSFGDTEGEAWGLLGRLGYGVKTGVASFTTPFVELAYTEAEFDGYSERGGPFYATFEAIEANTTTGRLGVLHEQDLSATLRVYLSAAWAHVLDSETPTVRGAVLDIFELTAHGHGGNDDWAEFMAGARSQVSERGVLSVTGRIATEFDDFFSLGGRLGYSHIF